MSQPLKVGTVSYDVAISPLPLEAIVSLSVVQNAVTLTLTDVPSLSVELTPTYSVNPINDILTTAGLVVNLLSSDIASQIVNHVTGLSAKVYTISPVTVSDAGISLTLTPSSVALAGDAAGRLVVTADLSIS